MSTIHEYQLIPGYMLRMISFEEYCSLCTLLEDRIFGNYFIADLSADYSLKGKGIESAQERDLTEREGLLKRVTYGIYKGDTPIGFHYSSQLPERVILMRDTGILPEHQGKGLYKAFLSMLLKQFDEAGFREVVSFHKSTNNQVIVPKLKAGFIISGFEVSVDGLHVKLSYPFSRLEREILKARSGEKRPEGLVREALKL